MDSKPDFDNQRLMEPVHKPDFFTIEEIVEETAEVRTFFFKENLDARPGQFVMVWLPGVNEKPFSLSYVGKHTGITIAKVGDFTEKMFKLRVGDKVGVRGPYGTHYTVDGGNVLVVCGGFGAASVAPLVDELSGVAEKIYVVVGAKTRDKLFFVERFKAAGAEVCVTTDDGSAGLHCLATDNLPELHKTEEFDRIYSCGPEAMMKKTMDFALAEKIHCQLSLERYMKCGIGLCGACCVGELRVCKDGPVFNAEKLLDTEFGVLSREASGKPRKI